MNERAWSVEAAIFDFAGEDPLLICPVMGLELFHPTVARWFKERFGAPSPPQLEAWPAIRRGEDVLVAAPTGSGKTLAAFMAAIDGLVRDGLNGSLGDELRVLYISPLKALSVDIAENLERPIQGIFERIAEERLPAFDLRVAVRTGDTPANERTKLLKKHPHLFVTTPESLFILLTSEGGRRLLKSVETVIVDEIHSLARDKRGTHLTLSLERLERLTGRRVQRIGLSATQKPIEEIARFLVGSERALPTLVDRGHRRDLDLDLILPRSPLEAVLPTEVREELYDSLVELIEAHRISLIFTNTRREAERVARALTERLGADAITSHHGSLAHEQRREAERRLKEGELRALVATASLELGIDVGDVDLVCQLGSPRSISTFLQRVGRSGHFLGGKPKGRLIPLSRDDLVECIALLDAVDRGELDRVIIPRGAADILAQQIVATAAAEEEVELDSLFSAFRRAAPYADYPREDFDAIIKMLSEGFVTSRGRRGAWIHLDAVGGVIRPRRGARLAAITNGGAIPDNFSYDVLLSPGDLRIGSLDEDFAVEATVGDIFQLGNTSYEILKVETGVVRVADAGGRPPTIPFWIAEAPSRTDELSAAVSRLRQGFESPESAATTANDLRTRLGIDPSAIEQLSDYLNASRVALGALPGPKRLIAERFFDEAGGMHLVIHAPFGSRLTRALGLALRKRFCRSFNVELQAAATEDALVLSLGPMHSFPLDSVFRFLHPNRARDILVQALLDSPLFQSRWRWNATRALAILRFRGGKRVPPQFQRSDSDDLLALVFPDQVACFENIQGDREIPSHPLVEQTIHDALHEAMDLDGLLRLLEGIHLGEIECFGRDLREPSPIAHEILTARPYAFLDDAPLEERRTQSVMLRRFLDPEQASDLGALDPAVIESALEQAAPDPRDAHELHDAMMVYGGFGDDEIEAMGARAMLDALIESDRAMGIAFPHRWIYFATERASEWRALHPEGKFVDEADEAVRSRLHQPWERQDALRELARGRLEHAGPIRADELAPFLGVSEEDAHLALLALENEGFILRGQFRPLPQAQARATNEEFCERRLLARIHRGTLTKLRREIEPVSPTVFMRFLFRYHGVERARRREGVEGLHAVIEQLSGFEASAAAFEDDLFPARIHGYDPSQLDALCLQGRVLFARTRVQKGDSNPSGRARKTAPIRTTPLAFMLREDRALFLRSDREESESAPPLSPSGSLIVDILSREGALFFDELREASGLLPSALEEAIGEAIARGAISADSFAAIRTLLLPSEKRRRNRRYRHDPGLSVGGRFSAIRRSNAPVDLEALAWTLLRRWGVVFRRLVEREPGLPPWRDLLRVFHRLEARGEIRGGRFVTGFSGEQFALKEALSSLRAIRKEPPERALHSISAVDPLNLVGLIVPGEPIARLANNRLLFRGGELLARLEAGRVEVVSLPDDLSPFDLERAILRNAAAGALIHPLQAG